ncbi:MAG: glycosyltransferase family 39 protein, partial [Desulforhabdus sp.]|nr:glycosyltransferase family 39 protein [Desulforhabdus sp.]
MIPTDDQQIPALKTESAQGWRDLAWFWRNPHLILIAFYFLVLLPMTFNEVRYHGDELFYTDGAMGMIQTGDYVTPYYSSGITRFRKPVFAYWTIAASYKIFGISLFASRIPFLLAGCLVVWFTYKISFSLLHRKREAVAAVVVVFSNIQLLTLSTRSTPDILQFSFLMASLYGFSNILFNRSKTTLNYSYAYLGSALAIATKGLLGIFPVLFAFLLSFTRRRTLAGPRDLIHFRIILIAAGVALLWFILIFFKHGFSSITGFLGDQVTERMSGSKFYVVENILAYLWALIRHFAPWSIFLALLALPEGKEKVSNFVRAHKDASIFIIGWYAIMFLVFIWANIKRTRYLFPAYPLIAIMLSAVLVRIMDEGYRTEL